MDNEILKQILDKLNKLNNNLNEFKQETKESFIKIESKLDILESEQQYIKQAVIDTNDEVKELKEDLDYNIKKTNDNERELFKIKNRIN